MSAINAEENGDAVEGFPGMGTPARNPCHFKHDGSEMPRDADGRYTPDTPVAHPRVPGRRPGVRPLRVRDAARAQRHRRALPLLQHRKAAPMKRDNHTVPGAMLWKDGGRARPWRWALLEAVRGFVDDGTGNRRDNGGEHTWGEAVSAAKKAVARRAR